MTRETKLPAPLVSSSPAALWLCWSLRPTAVRRSPILSSSKKNRLGERISFCKKSERSVSSCVVSSSSPWRKCGPLVIHDARAIGSDSAFLCLSSSRARPGRTLSLTGQWKKSKSQSSPFHIHWRLLQHEHVLVSGEWICQVMQIWDSWLTASSASAFDPAYNVM
jgi:hypothetical protein